MKKIFLVLVIFSVCFINKSEAGVSIKVPIPIVINIPPHERLHTHSSGCNHKFSFCNPNKQAIETNGNVAPILNPDGSATIVGKIFSDESGNDFVTLVFPAALGASGDYTQADLETFSVEDQITFFTDNNGINYTMVLGDVPVTIDANGNYEATIPVTAQ